MARRRSQRLFDPRATPLVVGLALLVFAYEVPVFAALVAAVFGILAVGIWTVGAQRHIRYLRRWSAVSNMYALSADEFEQHVAETYAALGYSTSVNGRSGDQGIDVFALRGAERVGIQCKRWVGRAPNSAVQEAFTGQTHHNCTSAIVVGLGGFTKAAREVASTTNVSLIDGDAYADLYHRANALVASRSAWSVIPVRSVVTRAALCALIAFIAFAVAMMHHTSAV